MTLLPRVDQGGRTLHPYPAPELAERAKRPTIDELMDRIDGHSGGHISFEQAVEDVREDRKR